MIRPENFIPAKASFCITPIVSRAISKACRFVCKDRHGLKDSLKHICFHLKDQTLTIISTDGNVMYVSESFDVGTTVSIDSKYLISVLEARSIAKVTLRHFVKVNLGTISFENTLIKCLEFHSQDYRLYSARKPTYSDTFPDYEKLIPQVDNTCTVNTGQLKLVVSEVLTQYTFGTPAMQYLGRISSPIGFSFGPKLDIGIQKAVSRHLPYIDSTLPNKAMKYFNAKSLDLALRLIPDSKDTYIGYSHLTPFTIFAGEGQTEKIILMPLNL